MNKYRVGSLIIASPPEWLDITHDVGVADVPFTLAKSDGMGALQFSVGTYGRGVPPCITLRDLKNLLHDFSISRELGRGFRACAHEGATTAYGESFVSGNHFIRVWYLSNGRDVALVTYTAEKGQEVDEVADCEQIVASVEFVKTKQPET